MLRVLATQSTESGKYIRERLERGEYMTNEEMVPLVNERLHQIDVQDGFILEGYPAASMPSCIAAEISPTLFPTIAWAIAVSSTS